MMQSSSFLFVSICCFLIAGFGFLSGYPHEAVHVQAYANSGVPATTGFDWAQLRMFTQPDFNALILLPEAEQRNLRLENSINESVEYNTTYWFIGIMALMVIGFVYLGEKISESKK